MFTKWQSEFLAKGTLGRTTKLDDPDDVILKCANMAYRDMLTAGRFYPLNGDKDDHCEKLVDILKKHNYEFSSAIIDDVCALFGNDEKIFRNINEENKFVTRYGLAQKFVNMTFKLMYVFSDYVGKDIDFSKCDCPLDSIILNKLPKIDHTWSKITKDEYIYCQNEIAKKLKNENLDQELNSLGNLAYDFRNW